MERMTKLAIVAVGAAALLCVSPPAWADYIENFDSYANGSSIIGQGGWLAWHNVGGPAYVSNAQSYSASNSLSIVEGTDITQGSLSGYTSGQWTVQAYTYVPMGSGMGTSFSVKQYYPDNTHDEDGVVITLDTDADNVSVAGVWGSDPTGGSAQDLVRDTWVPIRFEIDLDAHTCSAYYGDGFLGTTTDFGLRSVGDDVAAFEIWANGDAGGAYYDNITLTPEPASMVLLAMGGGLALLRRKRAAA
jgi:hypothetical protein